MENTESPLGSDGLPSTDQASLDRLKRFGGGKLLSEMISLFLVAAPERLAAARAGLEGNDPSAVEAALHSLKSSSAQLGAMHMQRICEKGETTARAKSLDNVGALLKQLDEEFPKIQRWLEAARNVEAT